MKFTVDLTWHAASAHSPCGGEKVLTTAPSCDVVVFSRYSNSKFWKDGEEVDVELWASIPYVPVIDELNVQGEK